MISSQTSNQLGVDYFHIVYANPGLITASNELPEDVKIIRDWSWQQSAYVKWSYCSQETLIETLNIADLVVLRWGLNNSDEAESVARLVRNHHPNLPILVITYGHKQLALNDFLEQEIRVGILNLSDLDFFDSTHIAVIFSKLQITLPLPRVLLHHDPADRITLKLIESVTPKRLSTIIQTFFPAANDAYIVSERSSELKESFFKLFTGDKNKFYLLKFLTKKSDYEMELSQAKMSQNWLENSTVSLRLIPDAFDNIDAQIERFSFPPPYPICFESASTYTKPHETYEEIYRYHPATTAKDSFDQILKILASGQPNKNMWASEPPWDKFNETGFYMSQDLRASVLTAIDDLAMYGPAMYDSEEQWKENYELLERFVHSPIPKWMSRFCNVAKGHIHGNPTLNKCLVNPDNTQEVLLIDCGKYNPNGRLVSDLAIIERELKLTLLNTEIEAGSFYDLDVTQIRNWRLAESDSIKARLKYQPESAPSSTQSINKAYSLIGKVRQRALAISAGDERGHHYFAALLYWTLDSLKSPAIKPTKKFLALHSAMEILSQFEKD